MTSRWLISCVAAGLALSACSSGTDGAIQPLPEDGASTDAPDEPDDAPANDPGASGEPDDPFALPDEIDEDYIQLVVDEIMAVRTDAIRLAVEENLQSETPSQEDAMLRIASATTGPAVVSATELISNIIRGSNVEEVYLAPAEMSDDRIEILEVLEADASCITLTGLFDRSGTLQDQPSEGTYFAMTFARDTEDELPNDTMWKLRETVDLIVTDTGEPASQEQVSALSIDAVADIVDTSCGTDAS